MTALLAYAAVAGITLLTSMFALHRMAWADGSRQRLAFAVVLALGWPIVLPVLGLGSLAISRRDAKPPASPREISVTVAPAA